MRRQRLGAVEVAAEDLWHIGETIGTTKDMGNDEGGIG